MKAIVCSIGVGVLFVIGTNIALISSGFDWFDLIAMGIYMIGFLLMDIYATNRDRWNNEN